MRTALLLAIVLGLAGCQNADLGAYNHDVAHPYRITQSSVRLSLAAASPEQAAEKVIAFAAERPNNGSTFIVSAPTEIANAVRVSLLRAGIDGRDIRVVPEGNPAEIIRTDWFGAVVDCAPQRREKTWTERMFLPEDGFLHDNSNAQLLGCAVKRNIVEMTDDPRTLGGPVRHSDRDGIRGADVYGKYGKGTSPAATTTLPNWSKTK